MWGDFNIDKILENRNKNVKWNTVTYLLKLSCQGKKGYIYIFLRNKCLVEICQHLLLWTSHPPLPFIRTHRICINFVQAYVCSTTKIVGHAPTWTHTHWCRKHNENCFRINYFYTSRFHFWIGVLMQSFFFFFNNKKSHILACIRPSRKSREKRPVIEACVAASIVASHVRASWMHRPWRHTRAFHELIRQDNENKLLFWIICNILSHLSLINLNVYVISTC